MNNFARILSVALPLAGLAGLWGWTDYQSRQGNDWLVPIQGYDPRDLLRGHYIEFNYDWPLEQETADASVDERNQQLTQFCIEGTPPNIERIKIVEDTGVCVNYAVAELESYYRSGGLRSGRLYVAQTRAKGFEEQLFDRDLQGYVRIRQRADGKITPLDLTFAPISGEQREARDRQTQATAELPEPLVTEEN